MVTCKKSPSLFKYYGEMCPHEKLEILIHHDPEELLNTHSEIMSRWSHQRKYLFSNYDSKG